MKMVMEMSENKRYFSIDYDEEYYIFDSNKISKEEVLEKSEYSYDVFGDSLMEKEVLDLLNENEQLKKDVEYWKQVASQYRNEINVFKHKEQYKTECKNIYYSSD